MTLQTCPECKQESDVSHWSECEVGCEDCGSHSGARCPLCETCIDLVYHHDIEVGDPRVHVPNDTGCEREILVLSMMSRPSGERKHVHMCKSAVRFALLMMGLLAGLSITDDEGFIVPHDLSRPYVFYKDGSLKLLSDDEVASLVELVQQFVKESGQIP